jgi:hypothetical protein
MKKILIVFFLLFNTAFVFAQQFGNEWINYNQKYFYVKVAKTGIYRLDYNTLFNAGVPLASLNPKNFQMFGKEKELFIHVEGEQDNVFDPGDYIEFYGEKNDGALDTIIYGGAKNMPDTYYSLYNDTLRYYFTWNSDTTNKRMINELDTDFASYTPINYVWYDIYSKNTQYYLTGYNPEGSSTSLFNPGEGWFSDLFNGVPGGNSQNMLLSTPDVYNGPGSPNVKIISASASASDANFSGLGNHHLQLNYGSSNTTAYDTIFKGYKLIKDTFEILPTELSSPSTNFQFRIVDDQGAATDYQTIGSVTVKYPHTTNFASSTTFDCTIPFHISEPKSRLDITNYNVNNPILYTLTDTIKRIPVSGLSNNHQVLVPNHFAGKEQKIFLTEPGSITNINAAYPVNGDGDFTNFGANPVDSAFIILTHVSLLPEAGSYAIYRSSPAGGGYNTLVVDVEELYDQYGGGIQKHSLALRRFCADVINDWGNTPSNLFLLGKGIREATESSNGTFHGTRKNPTVFNESLVPSYGYPSSDVLISSGILSGNFTPAIPTGRLAAKNGAEVIDYLNKVIEYETSQNAPVYTHEDKAWMKHILHFSGGANANEQLNYELYLKQFENIAEDTLFSGYVDAYAKERSTPINPLDFSQISGFLEEGVSLMTFFGHASSSGFDQNIDAASNWNNQGKYPFLLGNGCYAGDIYQPTNISNSEDFVLIPNRGTIGFLSTSKVGFAGPLYIFSSEFYRQFGYKNYGQTVGLQLQKTVEHMENIWPAFLNDNVAMQMALHGDPAIKINSHKEPEFVVRTQDIFYDPPIVSLGVDSVNVNVIITNLGKSSPDSIQVELVRHFPNNNGDSIYFKSFSGTKFIDTVIFRIPVLHNLSTGINIFDVAVDIPSTVTEVYDEINNNQTSSTLFINSNGIATIYPYEFAIIPDSTIVFKASTLNPLASPRDYRFELDTTDLFNSPFKRYAIINSPGGVLNLDGANWLNQTTGFVDPLVHTDSTVYYWRVSPDSTTFIWDESSYQYIPEQTGWGQAHFFQFENNLHQAINYNRSTRSWIWDETYRTFKVDVYTLGSNAIEWNNTLWEIDGAQQEYNGCGSPVFNPSIHVAVVDPLTLEAWTTGNHSYGNINQIGACRSRPEKYFIYRQNDPVSMDSLIGFYNNYIPDGHYVIFYTYNFTNYAAWQPHYFSFFQSIGADSIYAGRPNEAFIYYTQKGNNTSFNGYTSGTTPNSLISVNDTLSALEYQGKMTSEIAGPAVRWDALYWQQTAKENPTYDSTQIVLMGIKHNGEIDTLINTAFTPLDSIINLSSIVDANIYPWVKLEGHFYDDQLFTPAQTQRWQLLYQPVPEIAVNPPKGYYFSIVNDSINEGQDIELAVAIENVSPYDMDSLLVHYWIEDQNRLLNYLYYPRQDSLLSGEILYDTISINSEGFPGLNSIWVEANPIPFDDTLGNYDQLEQYHFNNYLQIPFYVNQDLINPILDVTFDGIHILNGDMVSGKPLILITLKDENPFLVMNETRDTAYFAVYLTDPNGNQRRIYFNQGVNTVMNFTPSTGPNDKFKIEYHPSLLTDGKYQLLIQATDKSGNESGDFDYKIDFEVINNSTITEVMNYPNPFSTKTHFVFTLTGNTIPDYFKIQIMTISGKIVREIMVDELGPIRIGRNITEYAWDGRDEFGDLLANGIYVYRVITKINEEAIEKRESGADQFFKKGFGKMTLIR